MGNLDFLSDAHEGFQELSECHVEVAVTLDLFDLGHHCETVHLGQELRVEVFLEDARVDEHFLKL